MVITYGKYRALADVPKWRLGDNLTVKNTVEGGCHASN
jgi:hypothetical protein